MDILQKIKARKDAVGEMRVKLAKKEVSVRQADEFVMAESGRGIEMGMEVNALEAAEKRRAKAALKTYWASLTGLQKDVLNDMGMSGGRRKTRKSRKSAKKTRKNK